VKARFFPFFSLWLVMVLVGCGHVIYVDGPYHGTVIDSETKQPIEGAAVLAVWWKEAPAVGHYTVSNSLSQFANQRYLNVETYRKTGEAVATPVWFAEENGTVYIYSLANAGKVKRIRNNSKVRVVPCDVRGKPKSGWVEAKARILDERAATLGHELLNKRYGWMKGIADAFSKLRRRRKVVIALDII
jgi:PPOX class probable F420-dependent enzyme